MSYGVVHRLQRVSPDTPLHFHDWTIPTGVPVGMTSVFMHDNPACFPGPHTFNPDRWIDRSEAPRLGRYLVKFVRGARSWVDVNLARAEIYLTLAGVYGRLQLDLFETTRADVDIVHDFFNPSARLDSKGVRVLVK